MESFQGLSDGLQSRVWLLLVCCLYTHGPYQTSEEFVYIFMEDIEVIANPCGYFLVIIISLWKYDSTDMLCSRGQFNMIIRHI